MLLNLSGQRAGRPSSLTAMLLAVGKVAIEKSSAHFSTGLGFQCKGRFAQNHCFSCVELIGCQMLHLSEKWAAVGCRCCLLLFLLPLTLVAPVLY